MACDAHTLHQIYAHTAGYCHRCRRKLAFSAYARQAVRGAWDIDACLRPACGACLARPARPDPKDRQARPPAPAPRRPPPQQRPRRAPVCQHTVLGGLLGAFVAGPWGALVGGLLGALADGGEFTHWPSGPTRPSGA